MSNFWFQKWSQSFRNSASASASEAKRLSVKWSLTGGGRLREVVAMRVLTVFGIFINEQK